MKAPNKEERAWMDAVAGLGCCVCIQECLGPTPCAVHHLLDGGKRISHLHTIGLCDPGHHQNGAASGKISRHPWKRRFEARFGTEAELLRWTQKKLKGAV